MNLLMMQSGIGMLVLAWMSTAFAAELSEQDYFSELPTVLTVSRLAQPLNEAPGAVTVIDRETIRRSGTRELADVLRLVPGYLVGGFNGANPTAAYHAPIDEFGIRNLIMVDGRPVYSGYYQGDTHRGMMGVLLEDIERIEVLRGSNSAAYGANAVFGVINIITRHTLDTRGAQVMVAAGEGGTQDNMARFGWGSEAASFRLSVGRRSDSGYRNAYDDKIVSQMHLRGDFRPAVHQELMVAAGVSQIAAGDGFPLGSRFNLIGGNALRTTDYRDTYLHAQWRKQLSSSDEIKLTANFDEENLRDEFAYAAIPSVTIGSSGKGRRLNIELQHQVGIAPGLRAVWGAGHKHEEVKSSLLYARDDSVSIHEERLFGNLEWRLHPQWLINAGGFWGWHSWVGSYFSPRLMASFQALPDHTLRLGATESARLPTLFELAADVRYQLPLPPPNNIVRTYAASGNMAPEKLYSQELGYFGNFRHWQMTIDVRAYVERLKDLVSDGTRNLPGYINPLTGKSEVVDFINGTGFKTRGLEYQLRWKPQKGTEIWLNQNFQRFIWDDSQQNKTVNLPPTHATTIALFQKLPFNLDLTLMYHTMGAMTWANASDAMPSRHRLDARLAKLFRIGSTRVEGAFAVQAADGDYPEYHLRKNFMFERRAFGTLRIEF